jgi:hypothetical protein
LRCGVSEHPQVGELPVESQLQPLKLAPGHYEDTVAKLVGALAEVEYSNEEEQLRVLPAVLRACKFCYQEGGKQALEELLVNPGLQQLSTDLVEKLLVGVLESEPDHLIQDVQWAEADAVTRILSWLPAAQDLSHNSLLRLMELASKGFRGEGSNPRLRALLDANLPAAADAVDQ